MKKKQSGFFFFFFIICVKRGVYGALMDGHGAVRGVVRFVQVDEATTLIEGALDGLAPGPHALVVHTYGDTTDGVASVGDVYDVLGGVQTIRKRS